MEALFCVSRPVGLEPTTSGFGDLRSTNWTKDACIEYTISKLCLEKKEKEKMDFLYVEFYFRGNSIGWNLPGETSPVKPPRWNLPGAKVGGVDPTPRQSPNTGEGSAVRASRVWMDWKEAEG